MTMKKHIPQGWVFLMWQVEISGSGIGGNTQTPTTNHAYPVATGCHFRV
jgi:hypothetical protein